MPWRLPRISSKHFPISGKIVPCCFSLSFVYMTLLTLSTPSCGSCFLFYFFSFSLVCFPYLQESFISSYVFCLLIMFVSILSFFCFIVYGLLFFLESSSHSNIFQIYIIFIDVFLFNFSYFIYIQFLFCARCEIWVEIFFPFMKNIHFISYYVLSRTP